VHDLFTGTEHLRNRNFRHQIPVRARDQLGELAESFNSMTASIEDLLRPLPLVAIGCLEQAEILRREQPAVLALGRRRGLAGGDERTCQDGDAGPRRHPGHTVIVAEKL